MYYEYLREPNFEKIVSLKQRVGLDIESDGLHPRNNNLLLLQLSDGEKTFVLDVRVLPKEFIRWTLAFLERKDLICHNAKFDLSFLAAKYNWYPEKVIDTMLSEGLLMAGRRSAFISLQEIAKHYLDVELDKETQGSFLEPALSFSQRQLEYAAKDAQILVPLYEKQEAELESMGLGLVANLEFNLLPVVTKMEVLGVGFSTQRLLAVIEKYEILEQEREQKLFEIVGRRFNPRSPKQVKEVFSSLGIELESTSKNVLKYVKHPLAKNLLEYRKVQKLVSTYGTKLIEKVEDDDRIHPTFNQMGAQTGRFSSSNPNCQNIPRQVEFRNIFVAAPGYKFLTSDFSQIELRLSGLLSGEEAILEEFSKEDADMHRLTASKIFEKSKADVTPEERYHGKTANFSALYGISYRGFAQNFEVSESFAKKIIDGFWSGYPTLKNYMTHAGEQALKDGYSRDALGRICWFDPPSASDPRFGYKYAAIRREASNFTIQGLAAEVMKYAIVRVNKILGERGRIVLTVHDEIGVEVREDVVSEVVPEVISEMEKSAEIITQGRIKIPASQSVGDSWTK